MVTKYIFLEVVSTINYSTKEDRSSVETDKYDVFPPFHCVVNFLLFKRNSPYAG